MFYLASFGWLAGSVVGLITGGTMSSQPRRITRFIGKIILSLTFFYSIGFFGWSAEHTPVNGVKNIAFFFQFMSVLYGLWILYEIFSESASREVSRSSQSTGWTSWRETVRYQELSDNAAIDAGILKLLVIFCIHQIFNIIIVFTVLFK